MSTRATGFCLIIAGFIGFAANEHQPSRGDQIEAVIGLAFMVAGVICLLPRLRHPTTDSRGE